MSSIANWSYTATVKIKPYLGKDKWGNFTYGEEYEILCAWIAYNNAGRSPAGNPFTPAGVEFIGKHTIYTEDDRPKYLDMVKLSDAHDWDEIKQRTEWEMSAFADTTDYMLITG